MFLKMHSTISSHVHISQMVSSRMVFSSSERLEGAYPQNACRIKDPSSTPTELKMRFWPLFVVMVTVMLSVAAVGLVPVITVEVAMEVAALEVVAVVVAVVVVAAVVAAAVVVAVALVAVALVLALWVSIEVLSLVLETMVGSSLDNPVMWEV